MAIEIKSLQDILELRDAFSQNLEKRMKELERPGTGAAEALLEEKRAVLKQSKVQMAATEKSKAALVKRLDEDLGRHKQSVERLEREIDELAKAIKARPPVTGGGAAGGGGAVATGGGTISVGGVAGKTVSAGTGTLAGKTLSGTVTAPAKRAGQPRKGGKRSGR